MARWILLVCLACLGAHARAQGPSPRAFDPPPPVTSPAWRDWYDALLARRLAEAPRERARAYYFADDGSDELGDGSMARPYRSVLIANVILDFPESEDVALLFKRGDVWRTQQGILVDRPDVTIADWGDPEEPKPLITPFVPLEREGWLPIEGTNAFQRDDFRQIKWVRDSDDPDRVYARLSSVAAVIQTPGSWHLDTLEERLIVHPLPESDGSAWDPRTHWRDLEWVAETSFGVRVVADGVRIENLRLHGWGMNGGPFASQNHGLDLHVTGDQRAVAVGCEVYYGSSHAIAHASQGAGGAGGVATFVDCKAGLCTYNLSYETIFNAYALNGGHQIIFHRCEATHGTLPSDDYDWRTTRRGRAFYNHTGGRGAVTDLIVAYACVTRAGPHSCGDWAAFASLPGAERIEDVRGFIVDEVFEGGPGTGGGASFSSGGAARVNGRYIDVRPPPGSVFLTTIVPGGWAVNCVLDLDLSDVAPGVFGWWSGPANRFATARFWHCAIHVRTPAGVQFRMDRAGQHRSSALELRSTVLVHEGLGSAAGFVGDAPRPRAGALYAVGFDMATLPDGALALDPADAPLPGAPPPPGSPMRFGAVALHGPEAVWFDLNATEAWRSTVGPVEAPIDPSLDLHADGVIDIEDLHAWERAPVDVTMDSVIDAEDRAALLRAVRWGERAYGGR